MRHGEDTGWEEDDNLRELALQVSRHSASLKVMGEPLGTWM